MSTEGYSRENGPLMQPGGLRENFPEQVLSFLLRKKIRDRPASENGIFNFLEAKKEPCADV